MIKVTMTLIYKEISYFVEYSFTENYDGDFFDAKYLFTEGNYGCDCNRSRLIQQQCDSHFKTLSCGETIEMVDFEYIIY